VFNYNSHHNVWLATPHSQHPQTSPSEILPPQIDVLPLGMAHTCLKLQNNFQQKVNDLLQISIDKFSVNHSIPFNKLLPL
jgi:hypothetical protein